jgi:spermidine/putrescine-binding protein
MKRILGGTGAALAAKVLTGFAVVAFAAASAGAATEAAITGSLNPMDWGQQVKQQVATCKTTLRASGVRGIGPCVSAFAKQHGNQVSDSHQASNARDNKNKDKNPKDKSNNGHGNGSNNGQPSDKAHGKPSTVPAHS